MVRILGVFIPGKEERRKRDEEVLRHYFVYGAKHRDKVGELLEELIPGEKRGIHLDKDTTPFPR